MKRQRKKQLIKLTGLLTVPIAVVTAVGALACVFALQHDVWLAVLLLLLSIADAGLALFMRRRLILCERRLEEAQREIMRLDSDNRMLRLSLGQDEETVWSLPAVGEGAENNSAVRESASAAEPEGESLYRGAGVSDADIVNYFGRKKAARSGSAVYRAMSGMEARIRELERENEELRKMLNRAGRKHT